MSRPPDQHPCPLSAVSLSTCSPNTGSQRGYSGVSLGDAVVRRVAIIPSEIALLSPAASPPPHASTLPPFASQQASGVCGAFYMHNVAVWRGLADGGGPHTLRRRRMQTGRRGHTTWPTRGRPPPTTRLHDTKCTHMHVSKQRGARLGRRQEKSAVRGASVTREPNRSFCARACRPAVFSPLDRATLPACLSTDRATPSPPLSASPTFHPPLPSTQQLPPPINPKKTCALPS